MKTMMKKMGIVGAGTAAACVACCAAPSLLAPLLAWLGFAGTGLAYSPWLALVMALPAMLVAVVFIRRRIKSVRETSFLCGCENMCAPAEGQKSVCR